MNWKRALLVVVVGVFALGFFAVAAASVAATAALGTAAVAISESGVVQAFEEVADGAERLQIDVAENSVTFTNPDSGESRTVTATEHLGRGRVQFDLPEVTVNGADGEQVVISPDWYVEDGLRMPQITITDPDNGQSRVIIPNADRFDGTSSATRVVWDGQEYGPFVGLRIVGEFIRGLFTLALLVLVGGVVYILLRNRRREQVKVEASKADDIG